MRNLKNFVVSKVGGTKDFKLDLVNSALVKINKEISNLVKRFLNLEKDILKIRENLDFIKEQNININNRIIKIEEKDKFPDLRTTEAIENINKRLINIEKQKKTISTEGIANFFSNLSLKDTGKEKVTKIGNTFYKIK